MEFARCAESGKDEVVVIRHLADVVHDGSEELHIEVLLSGTEFGPCVHLCVINEVVFSCGFSGGNVVYSMILESKSNLGP